MPWGGYNFEDAILISERLVKDDLLTSVHIEEFEIEARETKNRTLKRITRDIPNVGEEALKDLDESGIIRIRCRSEARRYPCGQGYPQGRDPAYPEEKLLRAIFGEKAEDVKEVASMFRPVSRGLWLM